MPASRTEERSGIAASPTPDSGDELARVPGALRALGVDEPRCLALVGAVTERAETVAPVVALRERLIASGAIAPGSVALERHLLVLSGRAHRNQVEGLPVTGDVKALLLEELAFHAAPDEGSLKHFVAGHYSFAAACQVATLRRFPAGECHWEVSGLPRSLLLKVAPRQLPAVLAFIARRMGGFRPMFFPHLAWRRKNRLMLVEREMYRTYHRMARSMALQPAVRGFVGAAWFYSPDTFAVSPHLAWMARVFEENGGLVTRVGAAHPDSGVFDGGGLRKRLHAEGKFNPTVALVLWPRDAMLAWASAHPEYGDVT